MSLLTLVFPNELLTFHANNSLELIPSRLTSSEAFNGAKMALASPTLHPMHSYPKTSKATGVPMGDVGPDGT